MGSLEKFSEAVAVVGLRKEAMEDLMKQVKLEWAGVEQNSRTIRDLSARAVSELESKQKHSKELVESVHVSYALLNSKKRFLEEVLEKLDEKVQFVRGVLEKVEVKEAQSRAMRDSMDQQLKELALKEQQIRQLSEAPKLAMTDGEERKKELDLLEKALNGRNDEMDLRLKLLETRESELESGKVSLGERESAVTFKEVTLVQREHDISVKQKALNGREDETESRQKELEARELEVRAREEMLDKRQHEMDAEKERLEGELESIMASLVEREIASKDRESEFAQKQKIWESELEPKKASLGERENIMQSKAMKDPRKDAIQQPDSRIILEGNRRGFGDRSSREVLAMDSQRRGAKRLCSGEGVIEIKSHHHSHQSGFLGDSESDGEDLAMDSQRHDAKKRCSREGVTELKAHHRSQQLGFLDESDPEVSVGLVLKDTQKWELVRHFNVGQTWSCFDGNDRMPRTYVNILGVTEKGGKVRLQVEWMKPFSRYPGEKEWIRAGLPVGCGTFEPYRESVEDPRILFQPIITAANPYIIAPFVGETWAIYKDWDIQRWSSRPDIHRRCRYEIVEILPYPWGASLSVPVRVARLEKIRGSASSFHRRTKTEDMFVAPDMLYGFSHKVPSFIKNSGVFELDQSALPPGL